MNKSQLVKEAIKARELAYTPYSKFKVGAALITKKGKVYRGSNIENASYGLSVCAERVCIFKAISDGIKPSDFVAFAIVGDTNVPVKPCGACRQVMSEFFTDKVKIYLANLKGKIMETSINELFPLSFKKSDLK